MEPATASNGWVNTIDSKNPQYLDQACMILATNRFCTLATCSSEGWPWASPLLYGYDADLQIYWSSAITARHSEYMTHNQGRSAVTIYNSHGRPGSIAGLFLTGYTSLVPDATVGYAMERLFARMETRPDRVAADYLGESPRRFYQFQPAEIWITGARVSVGQQLVDTKIQLDREHLVQSLATSS